MIKLSYTAMDDNTSDDLMKRIRSMKLKRLHIKRLVICPACNHSFDPRNSINTDNKKKNKKSNNIHDASSNTDQPSQRHKKLEAVIDGKKTVPFGQKNASDFTLHKDPERKARYINRHKKNEKIGQNLVLILLAFILNMFYGIKTQYKNQSMI
jgi:DNA-directed RNA polymerase subunit M/transcription elongation factor TFIIS